MSEYILDFDRARATLKGRLKERAPAHIQLLTGPRQVGKTTLLLELSDSLGERALYSACDAPEAQLPGHWERLWAEAIALAGQGKPAVLLLDEVQYLEDWSGRLKAEWDRLRRRRLPLHVVASGSSALRLMRGSRESLAGRFERITLPHWNARLLADHFGLAADVAAEEIVRRGGYPGAMSLRRDPRRWRAYVLDSIIEPAIGRDLMSASPIRKPALLRQLVTVCAGLPAQIVSLQKLQGQLRDAGALETVAQYLRLLEEAFLVAPVPKYSPSVQRQRAAPPKTVLQSNALPAVLDPRGSPERGKDPGRFGAWVENACLAYALQSGWRVSYWREEPLEVDAVLESDRGAWAVEVKSGSYTSHDLTGLLEFCRRYPKFRPLLVTGGEEGRDLDIPGVARISWADFLLGRSPLDKG